MNSLIEVLREQSSFGFTGKVNLLSSTAGQFLGVIFLQDGFIVGAEIDSSRDKKALLKMIFADVESNTYKFIVEPELLSEANITMKVSVDEIKEEAQKHFQEYYETKKFKPAPDLKLVVDPEIIVSIHDLTPEEFDVISVITEWHTVRDIYKYSKLMEFEVTKALVSLRKKKALKVFQN